MLDAAIAPARATGQSPTLPPSTPRGWNRLLAPHAAPCPRTAWAQLATTVAAYLGLLAAGVWAHHAAHWAVGVAVGGVSGLFLVRLFVLQHDCGHRSFLPSRAACDAVGGVLSGLPLTPYGQWRRDHDRHHATTGDLDRRGHGDIATLTVAEWRALGFWRRLRYRAFRHPAFLFGLAPSLLFLVWQRLPVERGWRAMGARDAGSVMSCNAAAAVWCAAVWALGGWGGLLGVWLPSVVVAATLGVWLFYVQHQIPEAYWRRGPDWDFARAALEGSTLYRLPRWLDWCTGWISHHHVHHLAARIPNYRLAEAARTAASAGAEPPTMGVRESLRCGRLALWCEDTGRMVGFREARAASR